MELSKLQIQNELQRFLSQEDGLNQVLEMFLNSLMLLERKEYLSESLYNKGNGFRQGSVFGYGHQIELKIPRDRLSHFTPTILMLFREQESYLKEVSFNLYSKGLTTRDISQVMEQIYGKHYSKSSISNISQSFYGQMESWRNRTLESHYLALYIDGMVVKIKRGNTYSNESFYIILGLKEDLSREIISIVNFPTESSTGWNQVIETLKERGLRSVGIIVSDGLTGLDTVIAQQLPQTAHQKCIVHLHRTLMAYVKKEDRKQLAEDFRAVLNPDNPSHSLKKAQEKMSQMAYHWGEKYKSLQNYMLKLDTQPYFTFLEYDTRIRRMLYTTNWIERFNKSARRTLKIRGAFPNEESVLALITSVAKEKTENHYKYPIYNFKFEPKLYKNNSSLIY